MIEVSKVLSLIRPAVRAGQAYRVGGPSRAAVKLNQNESPFDLPWDLKQEMLSRFLEEPFNRYPLVEPVALQCALARHLGWEEEGILVGNDSNELMATVMQVVVRPGVSVVLPRPMFSFHMRLAELFEASVVAPPPRSDLSFDSQAISGAASEHAAVLIVVTTPNSPTGLAMRGDELRSMLAAAPGFVLIDEAYGEFSSEESACVMLPDYPNLLVLRTFSKAWGLAGLRLGYLVEHASVMREVRKARVPFMVDRFAELTALALLERPALCKAHVDYLKRGTAWLTGALREVQGVEVSPSQTNFVLIHTHMDADELMQALVREGVLVRSMRGYRELPGYIRVSTGTARENHCFVEALKRVLR